MSEARVRSTVDLVTPRHSIGRNWNWFVAIRMAAAILVLTAMSRSRSDAKPPAEADADQKALTQKVETRSSSDTDETDSSVHVPATPIERALDAPKTFEFHEDILLIDVLKSIAARLSISMTFDETTYFNGGVLYETIPSMQFKNIPLRGVLNQVTAPIFGPRNLKLELKESHGVLVLAARSDAAGTNFKPSRFPRVHIAGNLKNLAGQAIEGNPVEIYNGFKTSFIVTDNAGRFGFDLEFDRHRLDKRSWHAITAITPESSEPKDLGDLSLKTEPVRQKWEVDETAND